MAPYISPNPIHEKKYDGVWSMYKGIKNKMAAAQIDNKYRRKHTRHKATGVLIKKAHCTGEGSTMIHANLT